jgi:hypothetical protein
VICWANDDDICGRRSSSLRCCCEVLGPVSVVDGGSADGALRVGAEAKALPACRPMMATPAGALSPWSIIRSSLLRLVILVGVVSLLCSFLRSTRDIVTSVAWVLVDAFPPCRLVCGWWSWSQRMLCCHCSPLADSLEGSLLSWLFCLVDAWPPSELGRCLSPLWSC